MFAAGSAPTRAEAAPCAPPARPQGAWLALAPRAAAGIRESARIEWDDVELRVHRRRVDREMVRASSHSSAFTRRCSGDRATTCESDSAPGRVTVSGCRPVPGGLSSSHAALALAAVVGVGAGLVACHSAPSGGDGGGLDAGHDAGTGSALDASLDAAACATARCDYDCECFAAGFGGDVCDLHCCVNRPRNLLGICGPGPGPVYCACMGGSCDGPVGASCCRMPDGRIPDILGPECQPDAGL